VFKFFNSYSSLYFIAFFMKDSTVNGTKMQCTNDDCMNDLAMQLGVFMSTHLAMRAFVDLAIPYFLLRYRNFQEGRAFQTSLFAEPLTVMSGMSSAEQQAKKENYDPARGMDDILILYGYTVLFVAACPWAPFLALIGSALATILAQKKLIFLSRRPFPTPTANMEPWDTAFDLFGVAALLTNAGLVVFVSKTFEHWPRSHKTLLFLAIEHAVACGRLVVSLVLPSLPRHVRLLRMQQEVLVRRHIDMGGDAGADTDTNEKVLLSTRGSLIPIFDQDDGDEGEW